uniref:Uncharacterized protein n=1 Tax=Anguilla anguilla TaxID=7936 RepID=A0A0E9UHC7_ANGAN
MLLSSDRCVFQSCLSLNKTVELMSCSPRSFCCHYEYCLFVFTLIINVRKI